MHSVNVVYHYNRFPKSPKVSLIHYGGSLDSYLLDIEEDLLNRKDHLDDSDLDFLGVEHPNRRQQNEELEEFDQTY